MNYVLKMWNIKLIKVLRKNRKKNTWQTRACGFF